MYTLEDVRREYDRLDRLCGVNSREVELKLSRRAYRRLGSFRPPYNGQPAMISLSPLVLEDEKLFSEIIRHEYAHALMWLRYPTQRHGHDAVWRAACREVDCTPRSRTSGSEKLETERQAKTKYLVRCTGCAREYSYMRAGKVVQSLRRGRSCYRCAACGGKLSLIEL